MERRVRDIELRVKSTRKQGLRELAQSIKQVGIIEPIVLTPGGEVLSGSRRLAAAKMAGLQTIPTVISRRTEIEQKIARLDANLQVLPLGELEFDAQLAERKSLEDQMGKRRGFAAKTAKRLGVSKRTVEKSITRSRKSTPQVKAARIEGLSSSKVDELVKLRPKDQNLMIAFASTHNAPKVAQAVKLAKRVGVKKAIRQIELFDPVKELKGHLDVVENLLRDMIAGRVNYEMHNGFLIKTCHGVEMLLKHFIQMHKTETSRKLRAA
jgi:ParB family chromosome partitioning protein